MKIIFKTVTLNKYAAPVEINSKGEGISVIIDGKVSDLSKYARTGINEFTKEAATKSPNELLPFFMASMQKAGSQGISFDDSETDLILNVLKAKMSSKDIKKIETIRNLSKIISAKANK